MNQGLALALFGAFLFGTYLVAIKRYFSHYPATVYVVVGNVCALAWYLPVAALTVPSEGFLPVSVSLPGLAILFGTAAFTAVALLSFLRALSIGDVSYVAPLSKIVPVFVLPLEVGLLGQHLTPLQVAGVVVATVAVYVANWQAGESLEPFRRAATSRAAQFALFSAATFGVVDVGKRLSMQELAIPPQTLVLVILSTVAVLSAPFAARAWGRDGVDVRADLPKFVVVGAIVAGGQHIVAVAFQTLPASVVSPIVNTQAVVAVVLGSLLLGESRFRTRLAASGLAVAGIALITLG